MCQFSPFCLNSYIATMDEGIYGINIDIRLLDNFHKSEMTDGWLLFKYSIKYSYKNRQIKKVEVGK